VLYSRTVTISADNDVVYINTRCGQNCNFFGVKIGDIKSYHFVLKCPAVPPAGPTVSHNRVVIHCKDTSGRAQSLPA
jgi:hypothetical protein